MRIVSAQALANVAARNGEENGRLARYVRAAAVARSRFAEEELAIAVQRGTRQCVILGAGMDTFAYRNPHPQLRVFEVDHPTTQASKREQLGRAGIGLPQALTFVPADLETQGLGEALQLAGFDADAPAFFSWLGVTMYLTREANLASLRSIASSAAVGSELVFTYVDQEAFESNALTDTALGRTVASVGEPFLSGFNPNTLARVTFSHRAI